MTTYTLDDVRKMGTGKSYSLEDVQAMQPSFMDDVAQQGKNLLGGAVRGAGSIGATLLSPLDIAKDALAGKGLSLESNRQRRTDMDAGLRSLGVNTDSLAYDAGKIGSEVAGTLGVGGVLANGVRAVSNAPRAMQISNAISSGGFATGAPLAKAAPFSAKVSDLALRSAGGGINGAVSAGMINPSDAETGAMIGGLLPASMSALGKIGSTVTSKLGTPKVPDELLQWVKEARNAGYVVPPTQAKPTFTNRMLEGFSGKITTAQNASAKNQKITQNIVKADLGIPENVQVSPDVLDSLRKEAGKAYGDASNLGILDVGNVKLPSEVKVNKYIDPFLGGEKRNVDAGELVRAWKQSNHDATAYYRAFARDANPETLAKAKSAAEASKNIDNFLENQAAILGKPELVDALKQARVKIAKTYSAENALNVSSGNFDAAKFGAMLQKKKHLSGGMRSAGDFANQFPKAVQTPEKMGSLPQVSPLDFGTLGTIGALTSNPWLLAGVGARPAARALVLSDFVQNGLTKQVGENGLSELLANPAVQQILYRSAPTLGASR